ncbi:hypothetical protein E6A54_07670 [Lactobacillus johnsonii]|uniref:hypothetical protein n=1 Tax=Lactobacillus johnsonii TaxID=33959 RepID=UPI001303E50A|nr:hypothetical protein [Lactobacillus johnsonii]QGY97151.1 hypothetical protein E6A54_07670 [Lactobacillus johnsonii]
MRITQRNGYSEVVPKRYLDKNKPITSLSTDLEIQYRWKEGRPTSEIESYKAWFSQEGLPPFTVKFLDPIDLPKYKALVEFEGLEGCEVKGNVYFRATRVKQIK